MKNNRRHFLKLTGAASLGIAGNSFFKNLPSLNGNIPFSFNDPVYSDLAGNILQAGSADETTSIIGAYGQWAAGLSSKELPLL